MKLITKISALAFISALSFTACVDKEVIPTVFPNADVDFTYNVDGDEYPLDFYVVSTIKFNNTSAKTGTVHWDFGDGTTSTDNSPLHKYEKAGLYQVTLTIDGVGSRTYNLLIYDIVPVLTVAEQSTEIVEINTTTLSFNLELPNPENLRVKYVWTFPEGTFDENGNPLTTFTGYSDEQGNIEYPGKVKFQNIGSQRIDIATWFDTEGENRRLEDSYLNVQVGCNEPAPTLYYSVRGGNIKAYKLVDLSTLPAGTKVYPYDLGVASGNMVFNLVYADVAVATEEGTENEGWIYMLDAGKQYYYINDENGVLGDGLITAMRPDGSNVNTVISNVGGAAFLDPFQGYARDGKLYYSDRNTGFSAIDLTTRGAAQGSISNTQRDSYVVVNNLIPYYGRGIAYGSIHVGMYKDAAGVWYWGKNYSGNGIYRFKESDIYTTQKDAEKADLPYPILLAGGKFRSFAIDEARKQLYVWRLTAPEGFCVYDLPSYSETCAIGAPTTSFAMDADPVNTTADEGVYTCQLALHQETGKVYFCFRPTATDDSKMPAGITVYDPATKKIQHYGEGNDPATGICINPNKTKLFIK